MLNDGDEVILAPYWVSYFEIVNYLGVPVEVPTSMKPILK
jgi:aspartate/methionine/tyrosine aminotransferase